MGQSESGVPGDQHAGFSGLEKKYISEISYLSIKDFGGATFYRKWNHSAARLRINKAPFI